MSPIAQWMENQGEFVRNLIVSGLLLALTLLLRVLFVRMIRHAEIRSADLRRRWLLGIRNLTLLVIALGLVIIWAEQLRTLALSIVAIAAAIVIGTKELITCVSGSLLKIGSRAFSLGDRIEIRGIRGDVIDQTLLATTIMEVGSGRLRTGRIITVPNALFVTDPVYNETLAQPYALHTVLVPVKMDDDWRVAERLLLQSATEYTESFRQDARQLLTQAAEERGLDAPGVDPKVSLQFTVAGEVTLVLRMPVPVDQRNRIEQAVLHTFLDRYTEHLKTTASQTGARS